MSRVEPTVLEEPVPVTAHTTSSLDFPPEAGGEMRARTQAASSFCWFLTRFSEVSHGLFHLEQNKWTCVCRAEMSSDGSFSFCLFTLIKLMIYCCVTVKQ